MVEVTPPSIEFSSGTSPKSQRPSSTSWITSATVGPGDEIGRSADRAQVVGALVGEGALGAEVLDDRHRCQVAAAGAAGCSSRSRSPGSDSGPIEASGGWSNGATTCSPSHSG